MLYEVNFGSLAPWEATDPLGRFPPGSDNAVGIWNVARDNFTIMVGHVKWNVNRLHSCAILRHATTFAARQSSHDVSQG